MSVVIIDDSNTSVRQNLEFDHYLYKSRFSTVVRIWRNEPSLWLGRFQQPVFEINEHLANELNIPVIKRFTGGGTVYQDLGNLNLSIAMSQRSGISIAEQLCDTTRSIISAIPQLTNLATIDNRGSSFISEKKWLGCASAVSGTRFFYHASMLIQSDLSQLEQLINWNPNYQESDRTLIRSHRKPVTNLTDHLNITINDIRKNLLNFFSEHWKVGEKVLITTSQITTRVLEKEFI